MRMSAFRYGVSPLGVRITVLHWESLHEEGTTTLMDLRKTFSLRALCRTLEASSSITWKVRKRRKNIDNIVQLCSGMVLIKTRVKDTDKRPRKCEKMASLILSWFFNQVTYYLSQHSTAAEACQFSKLSYFFLLLLQLKRIYLTLPAEASFADSGVSYLFLALSLPSSSHP